MINYNNGKIYKIEPITDHDEGDIYIGSSTKEHLCQRMATHSYQYKRWKEGKTKNKVMSFDLFDKFSLENCQIILLENVNANTKDELRAREKYYIKLMKCVNKYIPMRNLKEYYKDNKDCILAKQIEYRNNNQECINEKSRESYKNTKNIINEKRKEKFTCDCGSTCRIAEKQKHFRTQKHQKFINKII